MVLIRFCLGFFVALLLTAEAGAVEIPLEKQGGVYSSELKSMRFVGSEDSSSGSQKGAGNFRDFEAAVRKQGFTPSKTLNGFKMYEKSGVSIAMRSCSGYCCEGLIMAEPMSDEELAINVVNVYFPLQNTLKAKGKESAETPDTASRVRILIDQVMSNLKQANRTEFAFDHLNVRGQCDPLPQKEFESGKRPLLIIKLWIP